MGNIIKKKIFDRDEFKEIINSENSSLVEEYLDSHTIKYGDIFDIIQVESLKPNTLNTILSHESVNKHLDNSLYFSIISRSIDNINEDLLEFILSQIKGTLDFKDIAALNNVSNEKLLSKILNYIIDNKDIKFGNQLLYQLLYMSTYRNMYSSTEKLLDSNKVDLNKLNISDLVYIFTVKELYEELTTTEEYEDKFKMFLLVVSKLEVTKRKEFFEYLEKPNKNYFVYVSRLPFAEKGLSEKLEFEAFKELLCLDIVNTHDSGRFSELMKNIKKSSNISQVAKKIFFNHFEETKEYKHYSDLSLHINRSGNKFEDEAGMPNEVFRNIKDFLFISPNKQQKNIKDNDHKEENTNKPKHTK